MDTPDHIKELLHTLAIENTVEKYGTSAIEPLGITQDDDLYLFWYNVDTHYGKTTKIETYTESYIDLP